MKMTGTNSERGFSSGTTRKDDFSWIDSVLSSLLLVCSSLCEFPCERLQCPLVLVEYEYRAQ